MNYGTTKYGINEEDNIDEIKLISPDLMRYMPDYYITSKVMKELEHSNSLELGRLNYKIKDIKNQLWIDTATWGLTYWENEYGIETNLSLGYEQRREVLKAKKRGQGTTTKQMIKNVAETFSGGEVNIIQDNPNYAFVVQFVGVKGIPKNMQLFKDMLENIKPAHLGYTIKYTYTVWNVLKENKLTCNNAKLKTWDELKVYE
ncbi:YmfQ family protein [Clostridium beijerinckii]|jgi:Uncharacterized protein conserved in bacteria (DUF2313).|uniref:YmfQ family protein n=2 Tax=Clostridium beijerinckii TaxID=1520 RepID=A0AAE2RPE2_CLOBE|nr:YmfQ family protein [Clostridium beijerinckii]ABR33109.1 phage-like element pbsx protein XkdT [Clostridium beijerinckii NCIMB 8052]AIU01211.1 phage-like element pbsx protein XkdT [Clostridium beijerinckii ATCC 35702]MBF7807209.1 YmfQ family protein [Clostridium beijerinckii]NRT25644.1 hypothetical protein [Clostridium beijerinckii]NRT66761.1 hypothetical protein [Clostridium beijerinckii]